MKTSTSEGAAPLFPYSIKEFVYLFKYAGPWNDEPNSLAWEQDGFPCAIVRNGGGALCGYVGLPADHPLATGEASIESLSVHGGITWDKFSDENQLFWIGFDCAHSGDLSPAYSFNPPSYTYCTLSYVQAEITSLLSQLSSLSVPTYSNGPFTISPQGLNILRNLFSEHIYQDFEKFLSSHISPIPQRNLD